ncbi:ABC transporter substrate-binding protein [Fusobacterium sp.]|uniref:ABC transporter substrate-binding protein n=1 Tax=Fusobacterium sp. TaxID=68766 RepID=UPI002606EBE7|nr:ABC transporter substrate-binding protein [Fusobacterium sp.]
MKYINENMTILEICEKYPETIEFLKSKGFKNIDDKNTINIIGKITLKNVLSMKKINSDIFVEILNEIVNQNRNSIDITINNSEKSKEKNENTITMMGLLPCPVRIPLLEAMKEFLENNSEIDLSYDLKAASYGLDWLKDDVIKANHPEKLADIFISAGFDLFFEDELMGKFKKENIFKDITGIKEYNKDFNNEKISLKDPDGDYSMLGVVPAIFLVNTAELGEREIPRTWEDLLKPEFEKSVSLPISDFDLFNSILINIYKTYGKEAVKKLGKSLLQNLHPSQMIKSDKFKENIPTVTIMPYFFTKMIKEDSSMIAVWPEDGAAVSPIFMLTKKDKEDKLKKIAEFLSGEKVGKILSHQGLFPSINPNIDNNINGKKFLWTGWDYIHENNIGEILRECKELFFDNIKNK